MQRLLKYAIILCKNGWRVDPNDLAEDLSVFTLRQRTHEEELTLHDHYKNRSMATGKMVVELLDIRPSDYRGTSASRDRLLGMADDLETPNPDEDPRPSESSKGKRPRDNGNDGSPENTADSSQRLRNVRARLDNPANSGNRKNAGRKGPGKTPGSKTNK